MSKVFISYCHADGDFAEIVRGRIRDGGFTTWIDLEGLHAGKDWRQEIDLAIRDSVALITIVTPAAKDSSYVVYEWAFALGAGVRVIPILLQPTEIHPRLAVLQNLDFTKRETRPWPGLLEELQRAANARPSHSISVAHDAPEIVKEAVAALDNPDSTIMEQAVRRLAEMKIPAANAALISALNHPLPDVRIEVAWHLAERGEAKAVPALIEGTCRRSWRMTFGRKVAEIGSPAIPALLSAINDKRSFLRCDIINALREIGDPAVIPELIKHLSDPDPQVRNEVLLALKLFGTKEALSAVDEALPIFIRDLSDQALCDYTAQILEQVGTPKALAALEEWKRSQVQSSDQGASK